MEPIIVKDNIIRFKQITLNNIEKQGKNSNDAGETYRSLACLSNDFRMLTTAYGPFIGRLLYWCPVSWKASSFIGEMKKMNEEKRSHMQWVLIDKDDSTVGLFSLSELSESEKGKYKFSDDIHSLKLYNFGVMIHTDFQRRGIVTGLMKSLPNQIKNVPQLNGVIDGLFVATRPDNIGMNTISKKLNYSFIKEMDVPVGGVIPCFQSKYMTINVYIKRLDI